MYNSGSVSSVFVFAFLALASYLSPVHGQIDEITEPPHRLHIEIDGQRLETQLGQSTDVVVNGKNVRILVTESDTKEFNVWHLRFHYPSYFTFEGVVELKGVREYPESWALEGHDIELGVFRMSADELRGLDDSLPLISWLKESFKEGLVIEGDTVLVTGKLKLQGTKYSVPISSGVINTALSFEVFEVPGDFGKVRYFLLLTGWDGENPKEEKLFRELLRDTFEVIEDNASVE